MKKFVLGFTAGIVTVITSFGGLMIWYDKNIPEIDAHVHDPYG